MKCIKSTLALILAALMLLVLAACGPGGSGDGEVSPSPSVSQDPGGSGNGEVSPSPSVSQDPGRTGTNYWLQNPPDRSTVESSLWEFDTDDIFDYDLSIISVSPSGKFILAADQVTISVANQLAANIPNPLGRLPDCLYVFSKENSSYMLTASINVDPDRETAFSSTLGVCKEDGVAWNVDETQVLVTVGFDSTRNFMRATHSDIFLVDFESQTFENLTNDSENHNLFPQWADKDNIRFIRYETDNYWKTSLLSMNVRTGRQDILADLSYGTDGKIGIIWDYAIYGDSVYYSRDYPDLDISGFYSVDLAGSGAQPRQLLSSLELRKDIHPYLARFSSVQISGDGRWACLTALDTRIVQRDIPLVDFDVSIILGYGATDAEIEELRESMGLNDPNSKFDPSSATSYVTGQPWVPCHNVILYDLENERMANPFIDGALRPDVAIVTAATFAPDGKSLLCAVFGDGGTWHMADYEETTLYQVRLDDGSFDAVRIFKTEVLRVPDKLVWLGNDSLLINSPWEFISPYNPVQIITPSAFGQFSG